MRRFACVSVFNLDFHSVLRSSMSIRRRTCRMTPLMHSSHTLLSCSIRRRTCRVQSTFSAK
jgi:hypothetical protein